MVHNSELVMPSAVCTGCMRRAALVVAVLLLPGHGNKATAHRSGAVTVGNRPGYVPIPELSDEFAGTSLDRLKWSTSPRVLGWAGRAPGQ